MSTLSQGLLGLAIAWALGLGIGRCALASGAAPDLGDGREPGERASGADRADIHSYGNPDQVEVWQVGLDLTVDFERRELRGTATLDFRRQPGCPADAPLVLDTRGLAIETVELRRQVVPPPPFVPTRHHLAPADPVLGSRLTIALNPDANQVRIAYRTSPEATALQWLGPELTAGKAHPFLFTQSEAIHARSWAPLQDSPGVRIDYTARVRVPKGLTAAMSAESRGRADEGDHTVFQFAMPQPVPSYLMALAVGDLKFQKLGERTGVWAEPSVLKSAAHEFADVESMIGSIEKRFGRYAWGRYDILVLPPSFPFGGMENPKLTFATPTVLAGDRSLVSLIAHELAHSWSGNLVTNATWRDFWLNEGFTTYLERRIVEDLYGAERAEMEAVLGLAELRDELKSKAPRDQILHVDLKDRDPDEGMTRVPYEKGALFLRTLETTFGRPRFDRFLLGYFNHFRFQSITTSDFVAYLHDTLLNDPRDAALVDVAEWLEAPGLPERFDEPKSDRLDAVDRAARDWSNGAIAVDRLNVKDWTTQEWLRFLRRLPETLPNERLAELDRAFALTDRGNSEIAHQWLLIAIRNRYAPADARLESYLTSIGRRKLVLPLYQALMATPEGAKRARAIYARARSGYHPITADSIDRLMKEAR